MSTAPLPAADPAADPEATASGDVAFGELATERQVVSLQQLLANLTVLVRSWEGCEAVSVLEAYPLDKPDRRDGCNWSLALLLDPAGVAPELYALAYASAIASARASWNLE